MTRGSRAARPGLPRCRRSIRWTWPRPISPPSSTNSRRTGWAARPTMATGTGAEADPEHFAGVLEGVVRRQREIDPMIDQQLAQGWRLTRIDSILRAILRAGAFELIELADVPPRVDHQRVHRRGPRLLRGRRAARGQRRARQPRAQAAPRRAARAGVTRFPGWGESARRKPSSRHCRRAAPLRDAIAVAARVRWGRRGHGRRRQSNDASARRGGHHPRSWRRWRGARRAPSGSRTTAR